MLQLIDHFYWRGHYCLVVTRERDLSLRAFILATRIFNVLFRNLL